MPKSPSQPERGRDNAPLDPRIITALSHPLRRRVLNRLDAGVASPKEMADEFGESIARISYHVKALEELGCIELVRTTPRRGAIEHHYRAIVRPFMRWAALDLDEQGMVDLSQLLGETLDRALEIHAESAGRQIEAPPPVSTEVVLLHFLRPD